MRKYIHNLKHHDTIYLNTEDGFCKVNVYTEDGRKTGELYDLIIYPEKRGRGRGNELLRKATEAATEAGCYRLVLWPDCKPWVKQWYRRNGFIPDRNVLNIREEHGWSKYLINKS